MEFVILKNTEIKFPLQVKSESNLEDKLIKRFSTSLEARVRPTKQRDGTTNALCSKNLTTAIMEEPWFLKSEDRVVDWNFTVGISLPIPSWKSSTENDANDPGTCTALKDNGSFCTIEIYPAGKRFSNFLSILQNFNGTDEENSEENVTLKVIMKKFGEKDKSTSNCPSVTLKAKEFGKFELAKDQFQPLSKPDDSSLLAWKTGREFGGICTISVLLSNSALSYLHSMNLTPNDRFQHLKNLLKNEIGTDTEILVGDSTNQKVVKCHRAFLMSGSEMFQKMFESGLQEARESKIEMEGISENGVRALLAYLYHRETKAAYESSEIALELLEASEKYYIENLRDDVRNIMLARKSSWFEVDTVLSLYIFVNKLCPDEEIKDQEMLDEDDEVESEKSNPDKDGEDDENEVDDGVTWEHVKGKALKVLKWYTQKKPKTLLESIKYQEIFSKNPKLGLDISSAILRLK